ncbi:PREDICTED: uncharacterized protein LOC104807711 isoform X3 [Tarenaya hassleriana]|uniref:uncharacterized protein LOC104807711 isoform X3 n=1 Tax=Tarenaya hassleriana TaxID=28532 RepID=UPI00053C7E42|nr:PREDICTED: uncharacterized protein LOC104807711 isoform X3 [Tarenaya hassleriana]
MADPSESSPLVPPSPMAEPSDIDLEAGPCEQIQCRICLESDGRDFIAPCKCKGTSMYVHRECLDHWRSVKQRYHFIAGRVCICTLHNLQGQVIAALGYLVYFVDGYQKSWLRHIWGFDSEVTFYYMCGALLFFALLGLSGCFITCYDRRVRNDLAQPCRELCLCCCHPGICTDCHLPGTLCMWTDCTTCFEGCASAASECGGCLSGAGEAGLPLLFIMALIVLGLFTVIGIFYSVLVATMVGQRIWQRHYHILAKRMLTKVSFALNWSVGCLRPSPCPYLMLLCRAQTLRLWEYVYM